jgi:hypothetical protein
MKRKLALTAAFVVALAISGYAQKPDFSGAWAPDVDPAAAAPAGGGGGGRGGGGPMTVKQTATELSIERAGRGGGAPTTTTYKLDGTETEVTMRGGTAKVSAKFDGAKLVITTKSEQGEQKQTWSLADGKLTIERDTQNGPVKTVYKKTT